MQPSTSQTIIVRFGPDSAVAVTVHVTDAVEQAPATDGASGTATFDAHAGAALLRRALATPALVSQLNMLVPDAVPPDQSTDPPGILPRCTGGRMYQW